MAKIKVGVLTAGGDAPGMNAAVRAVVRSGHSRGWEPVGVFHGFQGLLTGEATVLSPGSVGDIIHRGGTILRSGRSDAFVAAGGSDRARATLAQRGIDRLVVIGGDGSLHGAQRLSAAGVQVIGIPATIDNDVGGTEATIGFDTAVNTVVEAIDRIRDTASAHERIFVVEVMGRRSGFIALTAGLAAGAESVLIPEQPFDYGEICRRLQHGHRRGKAHSIIVVAEGAASGFAVAAAIGERIGLEIRVTVLGHVQRGGSPSAHDRVLASRLGAAAVDLLAVGSRGVMMGIRGGRVQAVPLARVLAVRPQVDPGQIRLAGILGS